MNALASTLPSTRPRYANSSSRVFGKPAGELDARRVDVEPQELVLGGALQRDQLEVLVVLDRLPRELHLEARLAFVIEDALLAIADVDLDVALVVLRDDLAGLRRIFLFNKDFHSQLVLASENTLLSIAVQPIFSVMQTSLSRSQLGQRFHDQINDDHRAIAAAVAAGDEDTAAEEMHRHLAYLRPFYEKSWRKRNGR